MDKMRFESPDITAANIDKIAAMFPGVVTEGKVNFNLLRFMLGDEAYGDEAYEFTWVGKRAAIAEAGRPIRKTLRPCVEESKNWDTTENLYIEGDNLDVLKLLQESYLSKVKMIYIDPPYNTGNDFVYRDNFTRDKNEYDEEAGVFDEDGDRLFRNTERNGRFHSDWCSMMYPRLVLARNLLRDDGVIFISIDDGEVGNLREVCNEVFGEANFVCNAIWEKKFSPQNDAKWLSDNHDHILIFAKNKSVWHPNKLPRTEETNARFSNPDNDPRGVWASSDMTVKTYSADYDYPIITPSGREVWPTKGRCWSMPKLKVESLIADNRIWFGANGDNVPRIKTFLSNVVDVGLVPTTIWKHSDVGHNQESRQELKNLFDGVGIFDGPKPIRLLLHMLRLGSIQDSIILDFFSGSATTAHVVMQLNAEDGGKRKFIMVQLPEPCPEKSEAAKAGYSNICEIGKERIRRAGERIVDSLQLTDDSKEVMKQHGCIKLSRSDCLAKSDGADGDDLFSGQEIAERGNLRSVGSDEASGSVNSFEHSGGARKKHEQGIHSVSGNSTGIEGGIGDSIVDLRQGGIPCRFGHFGSERIDTGNRQNAECPHYKTENCLLKTVHCQLDVGFRVLKLDSTNMRDVYYAAGEYTQDLLSMMEDNIKDDRTDMDLLYACLLDWGLPLSMPHKTEVLNANGEVVANSELCIPNSELFTVHTYNDGDLIACFDKRISDKVVKEIARRQPLRVVFRDSSFSSSPEKINVEEIFKLLAPNTSVRVL
ncbi:MAG: Site-specific DNA-methyltransferase (Adenine-specific) [Desulfotomaculum sp. 46_296]|nr:MAG: Site-specific DNA-methyltransferase (Adenine-specific) [Desulfotomaculum sp. 46_296]